MKYILIKDNNKNSTTLIKVDESKGYKFLPKNNIDYSLKVKHIIIVNNQIKEFVLIKRDKMKLEFFFKFVTDEDDETDGVLDIVLDDLTKYREIVRYKYRKHLNDKYINILLKKLNLIEKEVKTKQINQIKQIENSKVGKSR